MAVDLDRIGRASLKELGDIRIDDVLSFIDRGIDNMPSYMDLYRRWEAQQWAVADIDFSLDRQDWLEATDRGFYRGFTAIARDESRHVSFGIKVLQEAVREDPTRYAPLIQKTLMECLPLITGTLDPPDPRYITEYGHTESEIVQFAFESLNKRLRAIGINLAA